MAEQAKVGELIELIQVPYERKRYRVSSVRGHNAVVILINRKSVVIKNDNYKIVRVNK